MLLLISIALAAVGTLFYLFYSNYGRAILIESQNGFLFGFAEIALMDLAARSTPGLFECRNHGNCFAPAAFPSGGANDEQG